MKRGTLAALFTLMVMFLIPAAGANANCGYWGNCAPRYYQGVPCRTPYYAYAPYAWGRQYPQVYAWGRPGMNNYGRLPQPAWAIPQGQGPAWGDISNQRPYWSMRR
ncbi:MAG: hypothetical protein ACREQI_07285 [Candidatus Binataceae bacterium]